MARHTMTEWFQVDVTGDGLRVLVVHGCDDPRDEGEDDEDYYEWRFDMSPDQAEDYANDILEYVAMARKANESLLRNDDYTVVIDDPDGLPDIDPEDSIVDPPAIVDWDDQR